MNLYQHRKHWTTPGRRLAGSLALLAALFIAPTLLAAQSPGAQAPRLTVAANGGIVSVSAEGLDEVVLLGVYRRYNGSVWESGAVEKTLDLKRGEARFVASAFWSPESVWIVIDPITGANAVATGGGETPRERTNGRTSPSLLERGELHLDMDAAFVWLLKPEQKGPTLEILEPKPGIWNGVVYDGGSSDLDRERNRGVVLGVGDLRSKGEDLPSPDDFSVDDLIVAIHPKDMEYSIEFVSAP